MRLTLVTPAGAEVVTLEEAKLHMRVDTDDEDALISGLIRTATMKLDGRHGRLGRCLIAQQYRLSLSSFLDEIALPLPPVRSVDRIDYVDPAGMPRTLDTDAYRVAGLGDEDGASVRRLRDSAWPYTAGGPDGVQITFSTGYGMSREDVPDPIRQAIRMHVAHLYDNRDAVASGNGPSQIVPLGYDDLISDYVAWAC
ncbi:head-tail connector protein [Methylobacterium sp. Leaf100]|uniref:head-tail connector protein n=1 Tax=Methylobacterium sp. Leaf100 TaxID=1736252 RepID=UPI0006F72AB9|nr:head-tail connector protein [Methylobacterium sp. Leaf100]KQP21635.1 hypothetical protein ASF25_21555 [Methylobacterium sp. Leaf100]